MRRDLFVLSLGLVMFEASSGWARGRRSRSKIARLPKVVRRYVNAWREGRFEMLAGLFAPDGTYVDDVGAPMSGATLVEYAEGFADAQFQLVDIVAEANGFVVHWRIESDDDCSRVIVMRDTLVLTPCTGFIQSAQSLGSAPAPEILALMDEYAAGWTTYDGERSAATFAEAGRYYDPDHPEGITPVELVTLVESLTWAVIVLTFGPVVLKDGRLFTRWEFRLASDGQLILEGSDLVTLQGDKILTVHGSW